tara:strand:- start:239 stop:601 length:363 start_codon:yes stop_codon:yes gene_type:complete
MVILSSGLGIGAIGLWITFRFHGADRGAILDILLRLAPACSGIGIIAVGSNVASRSATGQFIRLTLFRVETIFVSRHDPDPSATQGSEVTPRLCMKRRSSDRLHVFFYLYRRNHVPHGQL